MSSVANGAIVDPPVSGGEIALEGFALYEVMAFEAIALHWDGYSTANNYRLYEEPGGRLAISDVVNQAPLPTKLKDDPALLCGCIAGAATVQETETWLAEAGFVDIRVIPKAKSRELISTWAPGSGIEDFVVSAIVEGRKPAA